MPLLPGANPTYGWTFDYLLPLRTFQTASLGRDSSRMNGSFCLFFFSLPFLSSLPPAQTLLVLLG
jgi:hypothetical protein